MKKPTDKKLKKDLDKFWSIIARGRADHTCEICGARGNMDAHHMEGRGLNVRWDLATSICLCKKCHTFGKVAAHSVSYSGQQEFHKRLQMVRPKELLEANAKKRDVIKKWSRKELEELHAQMEEEASLYM